LNAKLSARTKLWGITNSAAAGRFDSIGASSTGLGL